MILLMINMKYLLLLAIVLVIAASCARIFTKGNKPTMPMDTYSTVDVDDFQTYIADPAVQLLDVRALDEYEDGHIAGASLVDVNDTAFVENAMAILDKQRPVAVYCRSGRRSARAASLLTSQGLKVTNLNGGIIAWQDAGKALVK